MNPSLSVPIDIGRAQAAEAARGELAKTVYARQRPSVEQRVLNWIVQRVLQVLNDAAAHAPGGLFGLVVIAAVVVIVGVIIVRRTGRIHRAAGQSAAMFVGRPRSAAQYRAAADAAASAGRWDEAVRQRFRAVVRSLEERDILDARPGRTAGEAAHEGARVLPSCAVALRAAAHSFDDVAYGGSLGDQRTDTALRDLDRQLARARPAGEPGNLPAAPVPVR